MKDFYELARSRGYLGKAALSALKGARKSTLVDFAEEASFSLFTQSHGASSSFGFLASTPLSGGCSPCSEPTCRVIRADRLARFAALYADHVRIRNPFAGHSHNEPVEFLRMRLAGDLAVMVRFEPLVRSGIVSVNPPVIAMCAACANAFELQREKLVAGLDAAGDDLMRRFMPRVSVSRDRPGIFGVSGPSELVMHGVQYLMVDKASFAKRLTRVRREELVRSLVTPMLEDVFSHHVHSRHTALNYLSDNPLDLTIARQVGGRAVASVDRALTRGLAHSVPVVLDLPIDTILQLRAAEQEAFAVYRNAVASVIRDVDLSSPEAVEAAFQNKIEPELAKIDLAVRNSKKLAGRGLRTELSVSAATVSIGMLLGTVQPAMGAVLSALGGIGAIKGVMDKVVSTTAEPPIVRDNSFYFLWKLRKIQRQTRIAVRA